MHEKYCGLFKDIYNLSVFNVKFPSNLYLFFPLFNFLKFIYFISAEEDNDYYRSKWEKDGLSLYEV